MNNLLAPLVALCVAVGFGCSGGQKTGDGTGSGAGTGSATSNGSGGAVAVATPITRADCEQMMGHILDVGVASMPEADRPAPDRVEEIRKGMLAKDEEMQKCLAFDRAVYTCVMKAGDPPSLEGCLGPE